MAHLKLDYKLEKAKKVIEKLDDSEESDLIRYYIKSKDDFIKSQREQIKEYTDFFDLLDRFLPNRNTIN